MIVFTEEFDFWCSLGATEGQLYYSATISFYLVLTEETVKFQKSMFRFPSNRKLHSSNQMDAY